MYRLRGSRTRETAAELAANSDSRRYASVASGSLNPILHPPTG